MRQSRVHEDKEEIEVKIRQGTALAAVSRRLADGLRRRHSTGEVDSHGMGEWKDVDYVAYPCNSAPAFYAFSSEDLAHRQLSPLGPTRRRLTRFVLLSTSLRTGPAREPIRVVFAHHGPDTCADAEGFRVETVKEDCRRWDAANRDERRVDVLAYDGADGGRPDHHDWTRLLTVGAGVDEWVGEQCGTWASLSLDVATSLVAFRELESPEGGRQTKSSRLKGQLDASSQEVVRGHAGQRRRN